MSSIVTIVVVWEAAAVGFDIPLFILPPPHLVAQVLVVDFGIILKHSGVTIYEIAGGLALAIIIGIPLGIIVATSSLIGRFIYPPIIALQGVPKVAIAPLFAVWMGYGLMPKVILTALIAFFPIVVATILGIRTVPPELISLARSMGLSRSQTLVKISLPHSLPSLFAGLEVALVFAIVGAIVAEFVGASEGLGYLLVFSVGQLDVDLMFAVLVVLSMISIVAFEGFKLFERWVAPWAVHDRTDLAR